jgi:P-type E1-E2 ATPase
VDFHASWVLRSIRKITAEDATVIRGGERQVCPAKNLVEGDLVFLQMGDRVPADIRIVNASVDLALDRSHLTGER